MIASLKICIEINRSKKNCERAMHIIGRTSSFDFSTQNIIITSTTAKVATATVNAATAANNNNKKKTLFK